MSNISAQDSQQALLENRNILVVDDEANIRALIDETRDGARAKTQAGGQKGGQKGAGAGEPFLADTTPGSDRSILVAIVSVGLAIVALLTRSVA